VDDNAAPWKGMRTVAEIRRDQQMAIPVNKDSLYKPITRVRREFSKIHVPKKLQESLPFASKPKQQAIKNKDSYMAKRAVVLDPEDRKKRAAIQMLSTIKKDKVAIRNETQKKRKAEKAKVIARSHEKFADVHKEEKKRKYVAEGKAAQAKEMAGKRTKFGKKKREE
jgi:ribosome biogenesis protein BMS1